MAKLVFLFPGQGGQFVGQGQAWAEADAEVRALFKMADDICERPISQYCFEGPADVLNRTINLQPAVAAVSLAALIILTKKGLKPAFTAGHSLGELPALCAAGVIGPETTLKLVAQRAALMDKATQEKPGAMLAVIGLPGPEVAGICELARARGPLEAANFNTPEQTVISGQAEAVAAAARFVKAKGGRALPLPVSGAFHSPLMAAAGEEFARLLDEVEFKAPACPVVQNVTGQGSSEAAVLKANLKKQITSPVRWTDTSRWLEAQSPDRIIEAWPKLYVASLTKKTIAAPPLGYASASDA